MTEVTPEGLTRRHAVAALAATFCGVAQAADPPARPNPAPAAGDRLPTEAFAADSLFQRPRISPDGAHLAVTQRVVIDERQVRVLTVYRLSDMSVRSRLRLAVFEIPLDYHWVDERRLVVAKGTENGTRESPSNSGELLAVDLDGSKPIYLYGYLKIGQADQGFGFVEGFPSQPNGHFYMREELWFGAEERSVVYDVNASNGARREVARLPVANLSFAFDSQERAPYAYGTDVKRKFVLYARDKGGDKWELVDNKQAGGFIEPKAVLADGASIALFSTDLGPKQVILQQADLKTRKVLASHPEGSMQMLQWTADGRQPFAAASPVGRPRVTYLDPALAESQLHQTLASQFPESHVEFHSSAIDGSRLVFGVSSDREPGSYYLFDRAAGRAELLFSERPQIDASRMATRRPVRVMARDGLALHGYLTLPRGVEAKSLPLVLIPHGGPQGVFDDWFFDPDAQFLANRGYGVLQLNYRGSGGRGTAFYNAGYKQWGGKMLDDLVDGVRWAIEAGVVDSKRVGVFGASYGGYAAMMLPVMEPGLFRCAAGLAGAYDLSLLLKNDAARYSERSRRFYEDAFGSDPATRSPVELAERIKVPVFLAHGDKDERTEPKHAERMKSALEKAGNPPEWMMVPKEGHGFAKLSNQVAFYDRLEAFLGKHLAPQA